MSQQGSPEVLLLGPLEVRRDGAVLRLGGAKPRALLADLALNLGVALSVDRLVDDLWGAQPPRSAAHAVEVYVSQLRTQLGAALVTRTPGYVLELDEGRLDVTRFTRLAETGRALVPRDPARAAATLREALALWRGRALDDFAFEPFAQIAIARLEELRQDALEERIEADLAAGRHVELVAELEAYVRAEPLRERLRGQLMLALYRSGRAADALASFRAGRELLLDELGIEPGPQLRSLEAAILRQEESLLVASPPSAVESAPAHLTPAAIVTAELEPDDTLDPEAMHRALSRWHERAGSIVERHLGTVVSSASESLVAAFGVPAVREDDVVRAARTALELAGADDVRVRVGLETGEVAAGSTLVAGEALTQARSAAREARVGEVVVGRRASELLRHAARFAPRSRCLLDVTEDAPAFERRLDAPLVGRREELAALTAAFDSAVLRAGCEAVRVVGPAGIGKTRLARELAEAVGDRAVFLEARCAGEGAGAGYRALAEVVRAAAGGVDAAAIRARTGDDQPATILAAALGAGEGAPSAQEVAWAFRRFCETMAATIPLLLVLDDLHAADASLLELVEHLVEHARGSMLVVCLSRDEPADEQPRFLERVQRIELDALSGEETSTLVHHLQGHRLLAEPLLDRVLEAAEGNPLFAEQLVAFVAEEGASVARPLPPTIHALLAARLDRLGPGERAVLARASVVGREFGLDDLAALLDADAAATAERHLQKLATTGFVTRSHGTYRFRHGLLQEAAYRALPKTERAELHERLADHLDRAGAPDELVGFHLECACRLHVELDTDERRFRQLAADAGARLAAAGILAWKRNDVPATVGLLGRALGWLPAESPLARELTCELGLAVRAGGDADRARELVTAAAAPAASPSAAHLELRARIELAFIRLLEEPGATGDELLRLTDAATPTFEAIQDERALGRAWLLAAFVHRGCHLRCRAGEDAAVRALGHYRRSGWPVANCLGQVASSLYSGPTDAETAAARCEALLADGAIGPAGEAHVLAALGGLVAMLARFDDGRRLVGRARGLFEDLGQVGLAGVCGGIASTIELDSGNVAGAESILRESAEVLRRAGLSGPFVTRAAQLADALYVQGRYAEAAEWVGEAESAAASDDLDARLIWQTVRAKLLARDGEHREAQALAREAWALAEPTDALNQRARVLADLAEVERLAGREHGAAAFLAQARREYEAKGNVAGARRLDALVEV